MSILLLNPRADFDFHKTSQSNNKANKITVLGILGGIVIVLIFAVIYQLVSVTPTHSHISLKQYNIELDKPRVFSHTALADSESLPSAPIANFSGNIPILMYHYTPDNFEVQLQHLQTHGYTTVSMYELSRFLYTGSPLPSKPVVITFDDGFHNQMQAFALLQKYQMKATFYIILGGEMSNHCIGLTRTNLACGDNYLNWSELKALSSSGLIEIGAHTLNHPDLANLSEAEQWQEISESKRRLEDMYNITITTFAYPYGRHNQVSIDLVKKAGFLTAVTTHSDTSQSSASRYTLSRVRDALLLP